MPDKKNRVEIVEVGPRDGLQNEAAVWPLARRLALVKRLAAAGLKRIEIGAFVSPKWVPQMADTKALAKRLLAVQARGTISKSVRFSALVPNERGMQDAVDSGLRDVAVFASATETFSKKNLNASIEESFARFVPVMQLARRHRVRVRGYLSVCFGCPYEGKVKTTAVKKWTRRLLELGVREVAISDTIGAAVPEQVRRVVRSLLKDMDADQLALHFHDTHGKALANITAGLAEGIRTFDASIAGLGGCPYAPGAKGNVATEAVVRHVKKSGFRIAGKVDEHTLQNTVHWIQNK